MFSFVPKSRLAINDALPFCCQLLLTGQRAFPEPPRQETRIRREIDLSSLEFRAGGNYLK
jgi:hypothetical protein